MEFEKYLQQIHIQEHPEILDDDLPDHFDNWIAEEPVDNVIQYAEDWSARHRALALCGQALEAQKKEIKEIIERIEEFNETYCKKDEQLFLAVKEEIIKTIDKL